MFHLDHRTTRHSAPDLAVTFKILQTYMEKNATNEYKPGRTTPYNIPDAAANGMHLMSTEAAYPKVGEDGLDLDEDEADVEQEVGDDGELDI